MKIVKEMLIGGTMLFVFFYAIIGFRYALYFIAYFIITYPIISFFYKPFDRKAEEINNTLAIGNLLKGKQKVSLTDVSNLLKINSDEVKLVVDKLVAQGSLVEDIDNLSGEKLYTDKSGKFDSNLKANSLKALISLILVGLYFWIEFDFSDFTWIGLIQWSAIIILGVILLNLVARRKYPNYYK